jgi:hypothetical protein
MRRVRDLNKFIIFTRFSNPHKPATKLQLVSTPNPTRPFNTMSSLPSTHRALVVNADQKGWEVKEQVLPHYNDVLVRVHAVALNPTDWKHLGAIKAGGSVGSDFGGIVSRGAGEYKEGDRVAGFTRGGYLQYDNGAFAGNIIAFIHLHHRLRAEYTDYVAAQQAALWRIPENFSFEQAAAFGGIPGDVNSLFCQSVFFMLIATLYAPDCRSGSLYASQRSKTLGIFQGVRCFCR